MRPLVASLAGLLALTALATLAYDCDALIAHMRQAVPAIAPEEMKPGDKDRAITLIWHGRVVLDLGPGGIDAGGQRGGPEPGTEQATVECPADLPPRLTAHWNGGTPPARFWQLFGMLGGIVADVEPTIVRDAGESSCTDALATIGPKRKFEAIPSSLREFNAGHRHLGCSAWKEQGGGIDLTLWRVE
jgi:hypothetical protein